MTPSTPNGALTEHEVHLWQADLDMWRSDTHVKEKTLDRDERRRAEGMQAPDSRSRFVARRWLLRALMAGYLETEPDQVRFQYGPQGKPALAAPFDENGLRFSLSHSGAIALYAIARGRELGVDIERVRDDLAYEEMASRFFSAGEVARLEQVPEDLRKLAFFASWTRKEAYVKARGEGLALPLDRFEVSIDPIESTTLTVAGDSAEAGRWRMETLTPLPGYIGALCVEGQDWTLRRPGWVDRPAQDAY